MNSMQKHLICYYRQISKDLPLGLCQKHKIIKGIKVNVECFIEEHPECSYQDILEHFGTAEVIAKSFIEHTPVDELQKRVFVRKQIVLSVIIALAVALLIYLIAICIIVVSEKHISDGYYVTTIEKASIQSICLMKEGINL